MYPRQLRSEKFIGGAEGTSKSAYLSVGSAGQAVVNCFKDSADALSAQEFCARRSGISR
jgi:hypothetical protein